DRQHRHLSADDRHTLTSEPPLAGKRGGLPCAALPAVTLLDRASVCAGVATIAPTPEEEREMECDVAVLGGGPGGYTAALRAAQLGARVVCVEKEPALGGTCLRVGCIPTKAWVQTAHALHDARDTFAKLGAVVSEPRLDFAAANAWKDGVVGQMTGGVGQ